MTKQQYAALTEAEREILNAKRREKYRTLTKNGKRARAGYKPYALLSDAQKKNKRKRNQEWMRRWYLANPDEARRRSRENYAKHARKRIAKIAEWKRANRDKVRASYWRNIETTRARDRARQADANNRCRSRRLLDRGYNMKLRLRASLYQAIRLYGLGKKPRTMQLVGCTVIELVKHIESKFLPGMSWSNKSEWEIDHIKPCSSFDLSNPAQQKQCFHYTNLQPLWRIDNRTKSARYARIHEIVSHDFPVFQ